MMAPTILSERNSDYRNERFYKSKEELCVTAFQPSKYLIEKTAKCEEHVKYHGERFTGFEIIKKYISYFSRCVVFIQHEGFISL